ncbi:hypothetical protein KUTeg_021269 [Tegillarca granosa]|uniref:Uncharacterized protein n=1 Tax=Tegillarca granosa TaxID=220873 RepID=A0ABQ9EEE3_TEGGR|nr:hypothetical protein KUTeg_021269 [Tegillarca granosa]
MDGISGIYYQSSIAAKTLKGYAEPEGFDFKCQIFFKKDTGFCKIILLFNLPANGKWICLGHIVVELTPEDKFQNIKLKEFTSQFKGASGYNKRLENKPKGKREKPSFWDKIKL